MLRRLFLSRSYLNHQALTLSGAFSTPSNPRRARSIDSNSRTTRIRSVSMASASAPSSSNDGDGDDARLVRYCDIGANLCDPMFQGLYGGKRYHDPDLPRVLARAAGAGVRKVVVTAGSLAESEEAAELAAASWEGRGEGGEASSSSPSSSPSPNSHPSVELYCSAGVHPTRGGELVVVAGGEGGGEGGERSVDAAAVQRLRGILEKWTKLKTSPSSSSNAPRRLCVALGETGLDYARLQFCDAETQRLAFDAQLDLAAEFGGEIPLFLHLRDAGDDFLAALSKPRFSPSDPSRTVPVALKGVVHSFDGGVDLMRRILSMGERGQQREQQNRRDLYIGINGCSLRDERGLDVARRVPLDRLLLETDAPWCDIRPTHASASQEGFNLKQYDEREGVVWKDKKKLASSAKGGGEEEGNKNNVMIKGRNEPSRIAAVAAAVAAARGVPVEVVARAAWENSERLFFG